MWFQHDEASAYFRLHLRSLTTLTIARILHTQTECCSKYTYRGVKRFFGQPLIQTVVVSSLAQIVVANLILYRTTHLCKSKIETKPLKNQHGGSIRIN